ncbi:MAG: ATP-binding protein, partial [Leptolyngbyaceae bacterium]|nr:ATP-binding protein [Leptolyngbyaceae bacterium]
MNDPSSASNASNSQSQDVQIGRDFRVDGTGHQVDFSQTHIETQIIQHTSVEAVQSRPLIEVSPYKGLKKFEGSDRHRFFGREALVTNLLTYLATHHCLILLGASGSGKSSLVRAGIIPQLAEEEGTDLIDLTFTPDEDPFDSLYASLLAHFKQSEAKLARQPHADTLIQVVSQLKEADTPWVIFVDQFEELFTITQSQKREAFIASLINLQRMIAQAQINPRSLYLIMAMRADFLDQFAPYRELGQMTERYMRFITNMTREDLQRAIANPANLHGVAYQEGLLKEILNDLRDQPGELPLLQYTLDLLWKRANLSDRLICCDAYWAIDGVQGALRQHVTEI